jgi:hypothetical protein
MISADHDDQITKRHNAHMNQIANRVSRVLDGENAFDVACVTALLSVFAICEGFDTFAARRDGFQKILNFMHERFEAYND